MGRCDGKVVVITGGARGQGAAEGRMFSDEGARAIVLADILDDVGRATAASIPGAEYAHLDVRSEAGWEALVADVVDRHGRLDVLINNAAIDMEQAFVDTTLDDWNHHVDVNQTGVFLGMRTAARAMIAGGHGGVILNISSIAGLEGLKLHCAYGATKFAIRGLSRTGAQEWGKYGIRVNSVHPGMIETGFTADLKSFKDPATRARFERSIPAKRFGTAEDVARLVVFLASDDAAYCTGQEYLVDGGIHR